MRLATFAAAATLLLVGGHFATAEEPSLEEALKGRIDFEVVEMPLKDVVLLLQRETQIQFVLQTKKLEEASVSPDTPVTKSLKRVRVSTLLDLILSDLELTYVEKDGLLQITTPEDAESRLVVRVYICRDLLAIPEPPVPTPPADRAAPVPIPSTPASAPQGTASPVRRGGGFDRPTVRRVPHTELERRSEQLIDLITNSIAPDSWDEVGGPGSISTYNGLFVVSQTFKVHEEVERVLDMLRQAADLDISKAGQVVR